MLITLNRFNGAKSKLWRLLMACGVGFVLGIILFIVHTQPSLAATCPGPDSFGYVCTDVNRPFVSATSDIGMYCDDCITPVDLPFSFSFYGKTYTTTIVSTNGNVQFESTNFISYTLPTDTFNQVIMPFGADLCTNVDCSDGTVSGGNGIYTATLGRAPNRVFIIEWRAHYYHVQALLPTMNFELQLEEQTNNIYFVYGNSTETEPTSYYMGGIQRDTGNEGYLSNFGPIDPLDPPVLNNGTAVCFSTAPGCPGHPLPPIVRIVKAVTPVAARPGQTITYTLVYSNASPSLASNVRITDVIPAGLSNLAYTVDGVGVVEVPSVQYAWTLADLPPDAGGIITITGVLDELPPGTVVINSATIAADGGEYPGNSVGFLVMCPPTSTVTSNADFGPGSLRQAMADVCSGGTIDFNLTTPNTITLGSTLLVNKNLMIRGPGAGNLTLSGNNASRVFDVNPELDVTIRDLTIADGHADDVDCFGDGCGGGMRIRDMAHVLLRNVTVTRCTAGYQGGAVFVSADASLVLDNASIIGNTALDRGGGMYIDYGHVTISGSIVASNTATTNGGGVYNFVGVMEVDGSILRGNSAFEGGAIFHQSGLLTMNASAVIHNTARESSGGAISNWNDAEVAGASITIVNTTIAGNWAGDFGAAGIRNGSNTALTLINSSVVNNTAVVSVTANTAYAAGIRNSSAMTLVNTLIAGNNAGVLDAGKDCWSEVSLPGDSHNLIVSNNGCGTSVASDEALLGPLGDYGGPTPSHALLPGSPAIDAGDALNCPPEDQRGVARTINACDIGAFESQGFSMVYAGGNLQSARLEDTFAQPLAVTVTANVAGEPLAGGHVILTAPSTGASTDPVVNIATVDADGAASQAVTANRVAGDLYTVTASTNGTSTQVTFTLTNLPRPLASVSVPHVVKSATQVILDASGSSAPADMQPIIYGWSQTGGAPVVLSSYTISQPTFTAPNVAIGNMTLTLTLAVTGSSGLGLTSKPAQVIITVEPYHAFVSTVGRVGEYRAFLSAVYRP